jgi:hypothetical protein
MDHSADVGPLGENPEVHVEFAGGASMPPNVPAREVDFDNVVRGHLRLQQSCGGDEGSAFSNPYRNVAILSGDQPDRGHPTAAPRDLLRNVAAH